MKVSSHKGRAEHTSGYAPLAGHGTWLCAADTPCLLGWTAPVRRVTEMSVIRKSEVAGAGGTSIPRPENITEELTGNGTLETKTATGPGRSFRWAVPM